MPGIGVPNSGGGAWWMEFVKTMLKGAKVAALNSKLPIPQPEGSALGWCCGWLSCAVPTVPWEGLW